MSHNEDVDRTVYDLLIGTALCVKINFQTAQGLYYDKLHIVKNLNEAVDEVRRYETRKTEQEKQPFIKGERYNLLRHSENLKPEQQVSLQNLLDLNENINRAYMLKEVFRNFWTYRHFGYARRFLSWWLGMALESEFRPLIRFGQGVCRDWQELLHVLQFAITKITLYECSNGKIQWYCLKSDYKGPWI